MNFFSYMKSADFWRQLGLMIVILAVLVLIAQASLGFFTRHGERIKVTDICGKRLEELQPFSERFGFKFTVIDSVYDRDAVPGTILSQLPAEGSIVKRGRTFYLVVAAAQPASVSMPNLQDLSVRQATALLEANGLQLGNTMEVPSIVKGAVVRQTVNGYEIEPGKLIRRGTVIDLEIGDGRGSIPESVLDTIGIAGEVMDEGEGIMDEGEGILDEALNEEDYYEYE